MANNILVLYYVILTEGRLNILWRYTSEMLISTEITSDQSTDTTIEPSSTDIISASTSVVIIDSGNISDTIYDSITYLPC